MKICDRLIAVGNVICYNVCADSLTTFKTGGNIDMILYPNSVNSLVRTTEILDGEEYIILGNGSNTLISDDGVEEKVISLKNFVDHRVESDGIYAMAGVSNTLLARIARDNYMKGLEFLMGIPGSVGGSIYMNAGAFGSAIGDFVEYVDIAKNGKIERISGADMGFCYRTNAMQDVIYLGAKFRLERGNPIIISNTMKKYQATRSRTQPRLPSLGSVFERVGDISAGYYIEKSGLSGYRIGGAEISTVHANFIVNTGGATSSDFVELAELARDIVAKKFDITLVREVRYIGRGIDKIRR